MEKDIDWGKHRAFASVALYFVLLSVVNCGCLIWDIYLLGHCDAGGIGSFDYSLLLYAVPMK